MTLLESCLQDAHGASLKQDTGALISETLASLRSGEIKTEISESGQVKVFVDQFNGRAEASMHRLEESGLWDEVFRVEARTDSVMLRAWTRESAAGKVARELILKVSGVVPGRVLAAFAPEGPHPHELEYYSPDDVPDEIDVMATVEGFLAQIEAGNFDRPKLVALEE